MRIRSSVAVAAVALVLAACASGAPSSSPATRPATAASPAGSTFGAPTDEPTPILPRSSPPSATAVPGGDACDLLSDQELLAATGAPRVTKRTGAAVPEFAASCQVDLEPAEEHYTWQVFFGVTRAGGQQRFAQEGALYGPDHHLTGIGDDALWRTFETDVIAVKGDVFAGVQYVRIPDFGATRPGSVITAELLKLLLTRV